MYSIQWFTDKPTEGWAEGQIELRAEEQEGNYQNWRIFIVVDNVAQTPVFIGLDDFGFKYG